MNQLEIQCLQLLKLEESIDSILSYLQPDTSKIRLANMAVEEQMSSEALAAELSNRGSQAHKRRYNISVSTRLRWMLDEHVPVFAKVDLHVAEKYRRKLLQVCHPDKGHNNDNNLVTFELVKLAYATSNIELLATMVLSLDDSAIDQDKVSLMLGSVSRKLALLKTKPSFQVFQTFVTRGKDEAKVLLQKHIDRTAVLLTVALTKGFRDE